MPTTHIPLPTRRTCRAGRLAGAVAAWLAVLAATLAGFSSRVGHAAASQVAATGTAGLSLDALVARATQQQDVLRRLDGELQAAQKAQAHEEQEAALRAQRIEQLKSQAAGVGRDLQLQELLAQAQAQAVVLSQKASELRTREATLRRGREQLVLTCDQLLAADSGGKLALAQRLLWLRLRTTQMELLHGADRDSVGLAVRTVVQAGAALFPEGSGEATAGDDPQVLRERADLLRDSADKLHREVQRLQGRSDELNRRQRLRERAARVDEDLFAEQTTSRHRTARSGAADVAQTTLAGAPVAAVPGTPSPGPMPQKDFDSGGSKPPDSSLRTTLDPSTLDVLQRAESLTDPVAKLQALQRAQTELGALTEQLLARAARLERRASELAHKK